MSSIRLKHASGNSMSLAAPGTNPASNLELKLPHTIGSANQLLKVDGSGQLGWATDSTTDSTKLPLAGGTLTGTLTSNSNINTTGSISGSNLTLTHGDPKINFVDSGENPDYQVVVNAGHFMIKDATASADRLYINASSTTITNNLNVNAGLDVTGTTTSNYLTLSAVNPNITFTDTNDNPDFRITVNSGEFYIEDLTNSATRLMIKADGSIRVDGPTAATHGLRFTPNGWNSYDNRIGYCGSSGADFWWSSNWNPTDGSRDHSGYATNFIRQNISSGYLSFGTGPVDTSASERLRITSAGRVGINESSPACYGIHSSHTSESVYWRADSGSVDSIYGSATALGLAIAGTTSNHAFTLWANNSEKLRITPAGDVGINTNSPARKLEVNGTARVSGAFEAYPSSTSAISAGTFYNNSTGASADCRVQIKTYSNQGADPYLHFDAGGSNFICGMKYEGTTNNKLMIGAGDSPSSGILGGLYIHGGGNLSINNSSNPSRRLAIYDTTQVQYYSYGNCTAYFNQQYQSNTNSGTQYYNVFTRLDGSWDGYLVSSTDGQITLSNNSDYRLKENVVSMTNGIDIIKKLNPITYKWKASTGRDTSVTMQGFFAHEVDEAGVLGAVDGVKDGVWETAENPEDAAIGDPRIQGLSLERLVPALTAALKEAITKIETLETKVAALEAG